MRHHVFEFPEDQAWFWVPAIDAIDFPWHKVVPGLVAQVGRDFIPVTLSDLSRYGARTHGDPHTHDPAPGDQPHPITYRNAVLGLYWLSVRIEVDAGLAQRNVVQAQEVFAAEVAHGVDYAMLTDPVRDAIAIALHPNGPDGHTWWEVKDYSGEYRKLLGETFMEVFTRAYTKHPITLQLDHPVTEEAVKVTIAFLTPERVPVPEPAPTPPAPKRKRRRWWQAAKWMRRHG